MSRNVRIYLSTTEPVASLIALLRRHTSKPISNLRNAISAQQAIFDEAPERFESEAFASRVNSLLVDLDTANLLYRIEVNGVTKSPEYLRNVFQTSRDIAVEQSMFSDLESGEPCIETLEWLKATSPGDVFVHTLQQIVAGDGYRCDSQTIEWARRNL